MCRHTATSAPRPSGPGLPCTNPEEERVRGRSDARPAARSARPGFPHSRRPAEGGVPLYGADVAATASTYDVQRGSPCWKGLEAARKRTGHVHRVDGPPRLGTTSSTRSSTTPSTRPSPLRRHIDVTLREDGGVRVRDNGRGIPTDIHPAEEISAVELVLTSSTPAASSAAAATRSRRPARRRLPVVNALSTSLGACSASEGPRLPDPTFSRGARRPPEKMEATDETGTTITFWPER